MRRWINRMHLWALVLLFGSTALPIGHAQAEWYVAPQFGVNFGDRIKNVEGTGPLSGLTAPSFDLQNSYTYGLKVGHYFSHHIFGIEVDALHSTPHIKNVDNLEGIHLRMTNVGIHLLARYPGKTYQPYVGIGPAILIARLSGSANNQADSTVNVGVNVLVGIRAFVTPRMAVFTEYKYTDGTPRFTGAYGNVGGFQGDYIAQQLVVGLSYHF